MSCFKGPTRWPRPPRFRLPQTDQAAHMTWDMLDWFVHTVFDPFAECIDNSGIKEITSVDKSITVTNPFGPVADLGQPNARYLNLQTASFSLPKLTPTNVDWGGFLYWTNDLTGADMSGNPLTHLDSDHFFYDSSAPGDLIIKTRGVYAVSYGLYINPGAYVPSDYRVHFTGGGLRGATLDVDKTVFVDNIATYHGVINVYTGAPITLNLGVQQDSPDDWTVTKPEVLVEITRLHQ